MVSVEFHDMKKKINVAFKLKETLFFFTNLSIILNKSKQY